MTRFVRTSLLICLALVAVFSAQGWARVRWEKSLKLTGNYVGSDSKNYNDTAALIGTYKCSGIKTTWVNYFNLTEAENVSNNVKTLTTASCVKFAETITYNFNAFTSLEFYLSGNDSPPTSGIFPIYKFGNNSVVDTHLTINKQISRYFNVGAGPKMTKQIVPNLAATQELRIQADYMRLIGYRARFEFAPSLNFMLNNLQSYYMQSTLLYGYKLGKRVSIDLTLTPTYNTTTKLLSTGTQVTLVYDFYMY